MKTFEPILKKLLLLTGILLCGIGTFYIGVTIYAQTWADSQPNTSVTPMGFELIVASILGALHYIGLGLLCLFATIKLTPFPDQNLDTFE